MFRTRITDLLGTQYPIVGGTMMWLSTPEFVAAISDAGGLGVLCSVMYETGEELSAAIDRVRSLTDKPFAVNINLFPISRPVDNNTYIDVAMKRGVKVIETSGHSAPLDLGSRFKDAGMVWMHKCVGIRYALKAQSLGADIITVVGYENGGATGKLDIGTLVLVPSVVQAVKVPVIGGGGVSDGGGFLAVLALGAEGVIVGTRLLATKEAPIHEKLKRQLLKATELDTMLVMRSIGSTHRVLINGAANKCLELEKEQATFSELLKVVGGANSRRMYETGALDEGILPCGQGVGLIHDIPSVKELFERIVTGAAEISRRFAGN